MSKIPPKLAARLKGMSSDEKLDAILSMLVRIDEKLGARPASAEIEIASDRELDSATGDEEVKKDPKRWKGESYAGKKMSETTPEYLDAVADFNRWAAGMSEAKAREKERAGESVAAEKERSNAGYRRRSARLAAGWAKRLRQMPDEEW